MGQGLLPWKGGSVRVEEEVPRGVRPRETLFRISHRRLPSYSNISRTVCKRPAEDLYWSGIISQRRTRLLNFRNGWAAYSGKGAPLINIGIWSTTPSRSSVVCAVALSPKNVYG